MMQINQIYKRKSVMQTKKFVILMDLLKKTDYNAKINEIENKIPSIFGLATTAALTALENKIPGVSDLVKKTDHYAKILNLCILLQLITMFTS